ncbi:uncharacterized protein JCM10292_006372 [Rhodotorula paludigena]|uniref:uncharacterized protein n=1 Tax=Rhodotorula paludigena TaxID=86838 RepID=UPI00317F47AA
MAASTLVDGTSTEDSLSALSSQLVSLGYLSRPLDLSTLFLSPAIPANPSAKALKKHHDLLILQARAREQIAKCLWGMLEQRQSERGVIEGLLAVEARAQEEVERERKARERAEREREAMGRELEAEKAKAREAQQKLKTEQERHRHARDELAKAKNALQFVKTQALHDQKRRETEVQGLHQRLQKLTTAPSTSSDSAFTRFVVLNATASSSSSSSPLSATFNGAAGGRASRLGGRSPPPSSAVAGATSTVALEAELDLLHSSLSEHVQARTELEGEVGELRAFVGEVGEWAEGVLEVPELVGVRKDADEGVEMRGVLQAEGDESYLIPAPHLALPVSALAAPLHRKLYAIRLGLLSLTSSSSAALSSLREELETEIERLHEEVEEEQRTREEVEREREEARRKCEEGERLVREWAERAEKEGKRKGADESDDDLPPEIEASLALDKQQRIARKGSKHAFATATSAAPSAPSAPAPSAPAARPSMPSAKVSAFLSELGLDTPAAENDEKAPLRAGDRVRQAAITSTRERDLAQSQQGDKPRVRPSLARTTGSAPGDKEREREGAMLPPAQPRRTSGSSRTSSSTATSSSSRSSSSASSSTAAAPAPSSTLADILALADSPPVSSEPLVSSSATAASRTDREHKERPVLGSSRVANDSRQAATATGKAEALSEEDKVKAKKQALLERARSARA